MRTVVTVASLLSLLAIVTGHPQQVALISVLLLGYTVATIGLDND